MADLADRIRALAPHHRHQLAEQARAQPGEQGWPGWLRGRDHTSHIKIISRVTSSYGTALSTLLARHGWTGSCRRSNRWSAFR